MTRTNIDLRKLRHVIEVGRAGSFTTASQTLHLSQPALTRSIKEVEDTVGMQLFQRQPRGVVLTEAGRIFTSHAQKVLDSMELLLAGTNDFRELKTGGLRIGVAPTVYLGFVRPSIGKLVNRHPGLRIDVTTGVSETLVPKLLSADIDVLVGSLRSFTRWPDIETTSLIELEYAFMVRFGHPLLEHSSISATDLLSYPLLLPASIDPMYTDLAEIYARNKLPPMSVHYSVDDFETLKTVLAQTNAFSSALAVNSSFKPLSKHFEILRDVIDMPTQAVGIATARSTLPTPAMQEFCNQLKLDLGGR